MIRPGPSHGSNLCPRIPAPGGLSDPAAVGRIAAHDPAGTALLLDRLPRRVPPPPNSSGWHAAGRAIPQKAPRMGRGPRLRVDPLGDAEVALHGMGRDDSSVSAFAALNRLPDDSFRRKTFEDMAWKVFQNNPQAAEKWVNELQGDDRGSALGLLGAWVAASDPSLGARYLKESMGRRLHTPCMAQRRNWLCPGTARSGCGGPVGNDAAGRRYPAARCRRRRSRMGCQRSRRRFGVGCHVARG